MLRSADVLAMVAFWLHPRDLAALRGACRDTANVVPVGVEWTLLRFARDFASPDLVTARPWLNQLARRCKLPFLQYAVRHAAIHSSVILAEMMMAAGRCNRTDSVRWLLDQMSHPLHPKSLRATASFAKGDVLDVLLRAGLATAPCALACACEDGNLACATALLAAGVDPNTAEDPYGDYKAAPLMYACMHGHHECAEALIAAGADVEVRSKYGETALLYACRNGHHGCVRALIAAGADLDGHSGGGLTGMMVAGQEGWEVCLRLLLDAGAGANARTIRGYTALAFVCGRDDRTMDMEGRSACVEALLEGGAAVDPVDAYGDTPLMSAAVCMAPCAQALIAAGANVNVVGFMGSTPLHRACGEGFAPGTRMLIAAGVDVNAVNDKGSTALILACGNDPIDSRAAREECVRELIAAGADVNAWEAQGGKTALIAACSSGWEGCTSALIAAGADFSVADDDGRTPLMAARDEEHRGCISVLVAAGADS